MEKRNKIIYWIATGLLTALMLFSASMYFIENEKVSQTFLGLGFPTYVVYPLAIAKLLGLVAILSKKSDMLKEWAYAGFFFNFCLATSAHLVANDGEFAGGVFAMVLLAISYFFDKKVFPKGV